MPRYIYIYNITKLNLFFAEVSHGYLSFVIGVIAYTCKYGTPYTFHSILWMASYNEFGHILFPLQNYMFIFINYTPKVTNIVTWYFDIWGFTN